MAAIENKPEHSFASAELYLKHTLLQQVGKDDNKSTFIGIITFIIEELSPHIIRYDRAAAKGRSNIINLYNSIYQTALKLKIHQKSKLRQRLAQFKYKIEKFLETPMDFISLEEQLIMVELDCIDSEIIELLSQLSILILNKLQLAENSLSCSSSDSKILRKTIEISKKVMIFGAYLAFETHGKIALRQVSKSPSQFSRCKKAVTANIKPGIFAASPYEGIDVIEAFKIENGFLLSTFEKQKKEFKTKAMLKGLFLTITENQILEVVLSGVERKLTLSEISQIPKTFESKAYAETRRQLKETISKFNKGFDIPLYMSTYSFGEEMKEDYCSPDIIIMVLCRVIVPHDKNTSGEVFYSKLKDSYEIHNPSLVYPEYILICKLTTENLIQTPRGKETERNKAEISKIEQEEEKIREQIKKKHECFWEKVSKKVQKELHPKVIDNREFVIEELGFQIKEGRKWIDTISNGSSQLKIILN